MGASVTQYWPFSSIRGHGLVRERLIVSLDDASPREALQLVDRLARTIAMFRVGRRLFWRAGADFVREVRSRGAEVFLDLKFHDTAGAVCRGAKEATRLGVRMFDVLPFGGRETMERARIEVSKVCSSEGLRRPQILAVTTLSPLDSKAASGPAGAQGCAMRLARAAAEASLDGVVTSLQETAAVRMNCGRRFTIVTSGVRLDPTADGTSAGAGPTEALRAGADYLVVGSRIWNAEEPAREVRRIVFEMERALRATPPGTPSPR